MVKIKDVTKLQQDIENDPIIKDQMANFGCFSVCTFGNFLAPVLDYGHIVNNLVLSHEQSFEIKAKKVIKQADTQKELPLRILYRGLRYKI